MNLYSIEPMPGKYRKMKMKSPVEARSAGRIILAFSILLFARSSASAVAGTILAQSELVKTLADLPGYVTIDASNGAMTSLGFIYGAIAPSHYAFDPNSSTLFGFDSGNLIKLRPAGTVPGVGFNLPRTSLIASTIGPVGVPRLTGLAFDPLGNRLFAIDSGNQLMDVNIVTGAGTVIASINSRVLDLAFDPRIGLLVGTRKRDGFGPDLISIDPITGVSTRITGFGSVEGVSGTAFDPTANTLIVVANNGRTRFGLVAAGELIGVDTTTGETAIIAPVAPSLYTIHAEFDLDFLPRITVIPNTFFIPEASTLMLGLVSGAVLGLRRRAFTRHRCRAYDGERIRERSSGSGKAEGRVNTNRR